MKICLNSKRKKSQDKSAYDSAQIDSNKCLHRRDIAEKSK